MKRAVGQRSSERRKFRFRQNSHSSRPSNPPRRATLAPDAQLPPLFKFHAARTEIRAKSAEFLLDKTPKKFEDEETRRKMEGRVRERREGSVPTQHQTLHRSLHTYTLIQKLPLTTLSLFHCFTILPFIWTLSVSFVSSSLCYFTLCHLALTFHFSVC